MNLTEIISVLHSLTEEFIAIAHMVIESSDKRRIHTEEAIILLRQSTEIADVFNHEIEIIFRANKKVREQDNIVLNSCILLQSNVDKQNEIIDSLRQYQSFDNLSLLKLKELNSGLVEKFQKAFPLIHDIIKKDNEITLMDSLVIQRNSIQKESLQRLKRLAIKMLDDASSAIKGSSLNFEKGQNILSQIEGLASIIGSGDMEKLSMLIEDARSGWNNARMVNRSSVTQFEFADTVRRFTSNLHEDACAIKELVLKKHDITKIYHELIAEMTVILSLEFKIYNEASSVIEHMSVSQSTNKEQRELISNLVAYVAIAVREIEFLANLNFDMTDNMNLNADLEIKSIALTNLEMEYFDQIRREVDEMTDATKYPIVGSAKNIENGKLIEQNLRELAQILTDGKASSL
jgi:hypothetical protein